MSSSSVRWTTLVVSVIVLAAGPAAAASTAAAASPAGARMPPVAAVFSPSARWHPPLGYPRVKVTVAGGCPTTVVKYRTVANKHGGSATRLVRPDPDAGLICRYGGVSDPARYRDVTLDRAEARRLTGIVDRISTAPPVGAAACPEDNGSATILAFAYAGGGYGDLWFHDSGCETLDNGNLAASEVGHPEFSNVFDRAVGRLAPPPPA